VFGSPTEDGVRPAATVLVGLGQFDGVESLAARPDRYLPDVAGHDSRKGLESDEL